MSYTRRSFVRAATAAGISALSYSRVLGANDRIRVGFIGLGNRGDQILDAFLTHSDAEVVSLCDLYAPYLEFAASKVRGAAQQGTPQQHKDYRQMLERKDLDAVAVCTPDHWHALHMIHACEAGKDVYVEKPLSLTVHEGRRMVEAATRTKRVVQVGLQRHSSPFCKEAAEIVRSGGIGKVTAVRCFHISNEWPRGLGNPPDGASMPGLDWDAWLGPARRVAFNKNKSFYRFRWFFDYSGGQLTNFGVHYLDMINWALGADSPEAVTALGGKFAMEDNREIPDTLEVLWKYPNGVLVSFSQYNANATPVGLRNGEIEFRGTKGTLFLQSGGYEVVPETIMQKELTARTPIDRASERGYRDGAAPQIEARKGTGRTTNEAHVRNFLDCVRTRQKCNCDIETGHHSTVPALIGNIAYRTRAYLEWDGKKEQFTNHPDANKLLAYNYRAPYKLP
jgi:predicted dehydrogenase